MSLGARIAALGLEAPLVGLLRGLSLRAPRELTRLLDERAATPTFPLDYWVPLRLVGTLVDADAHLFAIPQLLGAPLGRPEALRFAEQLGCTRPEDSVHRLEGLALWMRAEGAASAWEVAPLARRFASDPERLPDPGRVLAVLTAAATRDEVPAEALPNLARLAIALEEPAALPHLAVGAVHVLGEDDPDGALALADELARIDPSEGAAVLLAAAQALALADRDAEAFVVANRAAAEAGAGSAERARAREEAADVAPDPATGIGLLVEAHGLWSTLDEPEAAGRCAAALAELALEAGQAREAETWIRERQRLASAAGAREESADALEQLARCEELRGRPRAAAEARSQADALRT